MSNLWTGKIVSFHPLFEKNSLLGFAITSRDNKVFYESTANYNALLSEAKSVIVFDSCAIKDKLKDFIQVKHNLRTLYFQVNSQNRFRTVKDLLKYEYYTEDSSSYSYLGNTSRIEGAKQTILEASFIRTFYIEHYKEVNKSILKLDNSLLEELSHKKGVIKIDQLSVRSDMSQYQLLQWKTERDIFHIVGYPVVSISQLTFKQQQDEVLQKLFEIKNKSKSKYENLIPFYGKEEIDISFDVTATSTGRILCRREDSLFAPDNSYKQNFCAPDGFCFISADYSKQEATILACITDDSRLKRDLLHKGYYSKLSKLLTGIEDKQTGKDLFYALTYGVSTKVLADRLNISEKRAEEIKSKLKKRYSALTDWLKTVKKLNTNYFGRRLYESTANAYVQSTAADIVRMKLLDTYSYNPICVFSDNIIFCVPEDNVNKCKEEIKCILEDMPPFNLAITISSSKNFKFS